MHKIYKTCNTNIRYKYVHICVRHVNNNGANIIEYINLYTFISILKYLNFENNTVYESHGFVQ